MEATELQIGDWVSLNYWDGEYPQQIHGINYNSWRGEGYVDWVDTEVDDEASINSIMPIPLTAEILEKNGWWLDEIDGTWRNTLYVYGKKAPFSIFDGISINYVHQLQHALRLCGLDELADNFQIV